MTAQRHDPNIPAAPPTPPAAFGKDKVTPPRGIGQRTSAEERWPRLHPLHRLEKARLQTHNPAYEAEPQLEEGAGGGGWGEGGIAEVEKVKKK